MDVTRSATPSGCPQKLERRSSAPSAFFVSRYDRPSDTELSVIATVLGLSATALDESSSVLSSLRQVSPIRIRIPALLVSRHGDLGVPQGHGRSLSLVLQAEQAECLGVARKTSGLP